MNIDEEIKKQELIKEGHLEIIKAHKIKVNEIALMIRRLQTVKRHAAEILGESPIKITKDDTEAAPFKDPAQLDIEDAVSDSDIDFTKDVGVGAKVLEISSDGISEVEYEEAIVEPTPKIVRKKKPEVQVIERPQDFKPWVAPQGNEETETKDTQAENDISLADY